MKNIYCDISSVAGATVGAYMIEDEGPFTRKLSASLRGTIAELKHIERLIREFGQPDVMIHHDVCQLESCLKKWRRLRKLIEKTGVQLCYLPRKQRHQNYFRCHKAAISLARSSVQRQRPA